MSTLPFDQFTRLDNFGHSLRAASFLFRPKDVDEVPAVFQVARRHGLTVALRGAGRSYNDAALNGGGLLLDISGLDQITSWDPASGRITVGPGVTLRQLWQTVLPDGWWPPVVSGTMTTTLGGCLAMNIHGKNNFCMGTIGEHVVEFTALLPTGAQVTCRPRKNGDLFHAMIGGLGMLGVFTSITLQMKPVQSGLLRVEAWNVPDLAGQLDALSDGAPRHDYIVGWLDTTAGGRGLGRGQMHAADYLAEQDPGTLKVEYQTLPATMFGIVPKSMIHYFMAPFMNNPGAWAVNTAKYVLGGRRRIYRQPHAAFHFLLDYVPDWERAYGRDGLIQYQSFLPQETAHIAWNEMLTLARRRGLPAYLGVTKRHRPDRFLLTHALDGFSLALDFKVTARHRAGLSALLQEFDRIVLEAGGRFYFAKNSETSAGTARAFLGEETIARFRALKKRCDPHGLLASDLYRRVFGA